MPTDHIVTVKFYPGGLEAILGINQVQFSDQVVPLETILPFPLLLRVKQAAHFHERVELLQNYFLSQYQRHKTGDHYRKFVSNTIGTFDESGMELNTSQLADRMFLTSKTINRYFHRVIGTPPKQYLSMVRTRAALSSYVSDKSTTNLLVLLSKDFIRTVWLSILIGLPVTYFLVNNWLANYATRIELSWWLFAGPALLVFLLVLISIGSKTIASALMNPINSLRSE